MRALHKIAISLLVAVSLLVSLGCDKGKSKEHREAERIIAAIERLGTVPADERETHIAALEKEQVDSPRVQKLRDSCAQAYRALHSAQSRLVELQGKGNPLQMADELQKANASIEEAKAAHVRCNQALHELRTGLSGS